MNGVALVLHSFRRFRVLLLGAGALLAGFQLLLCLAAKAMNELNAFGQLSSLVPDFVRQLMGPSVISLMSFSGIVALGYFHIAVIGALLGLAIGITTETSAEIEIRIIDLILSRPLSRHWLITRSVIVLLCATAYLLLAMFLGTSLGLYLLAPPGSFWSTLKLIRTLILNLSALIVCWGGLTLAIAAVSRRRSVAGSVAGLLALATYLFDYVAQVWKPAGKIAWMFPFHYYNALGLLLSNNLPLREIRALLCFGAAGIALAYFLFSRRDV